MNASDIIFYGLLALVVVVLVYGLIAVLRAYRKSRRLKDTGGRIGVVEVHAIDDDRQLLLVRRDHVEHFLLVGGDTDLVIEAGIGAEEELVEPEPAPAPVLRPRPMAPPVPPRREEPVGHAGEVPLAEAPEPAMAEPVSPEPAAHVPPHVPPPAPEPRVMPAPPFAPRRREPEA